MVRAKFDYPDLDVLDSPLVSPTPLGSSVGGIPGSAIAEKIFNDPDSWEENDADIPEDPTHDPLVWLIDEIEKFKADGADIHGAFDSAVHGTRKSGLMTPPAEGSVFGAGLKGIGRTRIRPISITSFFDNEDIQAQLSKILDSGGIPHHVRPLSSTLSPPSTAASGSTIYTPSQINTASTAASFTEDGPLYSASATLSFLEWYGIYPDSPQLDLGRRAMVQHHRKSIKPKNPALDVPSPRRAMRPSSLASPSPSTDTFTRPPHKRVSSVPPPGLEPPTRPPRSPPPAPIPRQNRKPSTPFLDADCIIPSCSPPPYTRTPSPIGSRPNSSPNSRSSSNLYSLSRTGTSAQAISNNDSTRRRRLPSIPPDPSAGAVPSLQIQIQTPALAFSHQASSSLPSSTVLPSSLSTGAFASPALTPQPQSSVSRPLSARPPLVGPAGPRTRVSQGRMSSQGSVPVHRPPVLRL